MTEKQNRNTNDPCMVSREIEHLPSLQAVIFFQSSSRSQSGQRIVNLNFVKDPVFQM